MPNYRCGFHVTGLRDFEQGMLVKLKNLATSRTKVHQEFGKTKYPYDIIGVETWDRRGQQVITMTVDCPALRKARSILGFPAYRSEYNMHTALLYKKWG